MRKIWMRVFRMGALACAGALVSLGLGCTEEAADDMLGVQVSRFSVDVTELQVENNCDPASNADGGDFWVRVDIRDVTGGGGARVGYFPSTLVAQTKVPGSIPLTAVFADGETRQEAGRSARVTIDFNEYDGSGIYDARNIQSYDFTWSDEDRCWSYDGAPAQCIRSGEELSFGMGLNDSTAPYCSAGLSWTMAFETVRREPNEAHAGGWAASDFRIDITPVSGGTAYKCLFAEMWLRLDPEDARAGEIFEGEGECLRFELPSGVDYRFRTEAWFESDTEMAGRLIFEAGDEDFVVPFEGTRSLDEVEITISEVTPDVRAGGSLGDLHWTGGTVLRQ